MLRQSRIESAGKPIAAADLRIGAQHMTRSSKRCLGAERHRCRHRPRRDRSIIRSIGRTARHIAEITTVPTALTQFAIPWTIPRRYPPQVPIIAFVVPRIARAILAMDRNRVLGVFEVITALFAHERVTNASIVDPRMRKQMRE